MENQMVKGHPLGLMEESMSENGKMGKNMVKEKELNMVMCMMENGKMGKDMIKEHTLGLMEESMSENGRITINGTE